MKIRVMVCFPKGSSGRRLGIRSLLRFIVMEALVKIIAAQPDLQRKATLSTAVK